MILRHDNADLRLTAKGHELGLISDERFQRLQQKKQQITAEIQRLSVTRIKPNQQINDFLQQKQMPPLKDSILAADLLKRPQIHYTDVLQFLDSNPALSEQVCEQVEISIKYAGYIKKEEAQIAHLKKLEAKKIPDNIDYDDVHGLATEALQKLKKINPTTIAQAERISGVNPADISILMVYIQRGRIAKTVSK